MSGANIELIGKLEFREESGLRYSVEIGKEDSKRTLWIEAFGSIQVYDWPGLGRYPQKPTPIACQRTGPTETPAQLEERTCTVSAANEEAHQEWRRACVLFEEALHADANFRQAEREFFERQRDFFELQRSEPQPLEGALHALAVNGRVRCEPFFAHVDSSWWVFHDKVLRVVWTEPEACRTEEADILYVKHYVLRQERHYERLRHQVEALENIDMLELEGAPREPIAENVRLFVWRRDGGRCVKCGSRERLEFDHIIPVSAGGSSTERNVQLLCEFCNRSKGSSV